MGKRKENSLATCKSKVSWASQCCRHVKVNLNVPLNVGTRLKQKQSPRPKGIFITTLRGAFNFTQYPTLRGAFNFTVYGDTGFPNCSQKIGGSPVLQASQETALRKLAVALSFKLVKKLLSHTHTETRYPSKVGGMSRTSLLRKCFPIQGHRKVAGVCILYGMFIK